MFCVYMYNGFISLPNFIFQIAVYVLMYLRKISPSTIHVLGLQVGHVTAFSMPVRTAAVCVRFVFLSMHLESVCVCTHVCMHALMCVCVHACANVCMRACVCLCVCIHM